MLSGLNQERTREPVLHGILVDTGTVCMRIFHLYCCSEGLHLGIITLAPVSKLIKDNSALPFKFLLQLSPSSDLEDQIVVEMAGSPAKVSGQVSLLSPNICTCKLGIIIVLTL